MKKQARKVVVDAVTEPAPVHKVRKWTLEIEEQCWQLFLNGESGARIAKQLRVSKKRLRRLIEEGDRAHGKRPWRDRRADIIRAGEMLQDEKLGKRIAMRTEILGAIEAKGLKNIMQRMKKAEADGEDALSVQELSMLLRESTQAHRLAIDAVRGPQATTKVDIHAQAAVAASGTGSISGARITVATVKALQAASAEELSSIEAFQERYSLSLEGESKALPKHQIDAVVDED